MMMTFTREELKKYSPELIELIQEVHVMSDGVFNELFVKRAPVKGAFILKGYFARIKVYCFQYTMQYIITEPELQLIGLAVQDVTIYHNYQEYEADRVKTLSRVKGAEGLNFN